MDEDRAILFHHHEPVPPFEEALRSAAVSYLTVSQQDKHGFFWLLEELFAREVNGFVEPGLM
jgi:hypothetical protein